MAADEFGVDHIHQPTAVLPFFARIILSPTLCANEAFLSATVAGSQKPCFSTFEIFLHINFVISGLREVPPV